MLSLLIGCMKFVFPKLFVAIFVSRIWDLCMRLICWGNMSKITEGPVLRSIFLSNWELGFFHFLEIVTSWLVASAAQKIPVQPGWYLPQPKKTGFFRQVMELEIQMKNRGITLRPGLMAGSVIWWHSLQSQPYFGNAHSSEAFLIVPQGAHILKISSLWQGGNQVQPRISPHLQVLPIVKLNDNIILWT